MRLFTLLLCLSLGLLAVTCKPDQSAHFQPLQRTWLHANEEDQGGVSVYRPNTYNFPPSRGRTGFCFEDNGTFTQYSIAPTDGLEDHPGTWTPESSNVIRISFADQQEPSYRLEIVSLDKDVLKVRRIE